MMKHKIPVEWMQRYESEAFACETTCSGPLGAAYTPEADHLPALDAACRGRVVSLPEGRWKLLSDGTTSALWQGESTVCTGEFSLPSCSAVIFGLL